MSPELRRAVIVVGCPVAVPAVLVAGGSAFIASRSSSLSYSAVAVDAFAVSDDAEVPTAEVCVTVRLAGSLVTRDTVDASSLPSPRDLLAERIDGPSLDVDVTGLPRGSGPTRTVADLAGIGVVVTSDAPAAPISAGTGPDDGDATVPSSASWGWAYSYPMAPRTGSTSTEGGFCLDLRADVTVTRLSAGQSRSGSAAVPLRVCVPGAVAVPGDSQTVPAPSLPLAPSMAPDSLLDGSLP